MESLDVSVGLSCLRPASFRSFREHLANRAGHYHLVHLDGFDVDTEGLAFSTEDGERDRVPATELARVLTAARVPAALLTGQTSHTGAGMGAALVSAGLPCVTLLPYPLAGAGRQLFAQAFYRSLAAGAHAAEAVASARKALLENPYRPSASGPAVSWDWLTPVVYQSMNYRPVAVLPEQSDAPIPGMLPSQPETEPYQLPRGGPYGLIGRRNEVLELERRFSESNVVLVTGDVGVGKSELALGFAAWMQKTGGRAPTAFFTPLSTLARDWTRCCTRPARQWPGWISETSERRSGGVGSWATFKTTTRSWFGTDWKTWLASQPVSPVSWKTRNWRS